MRHNITLTSAGTRALFSSEPPRCGRRRLVLILASLVLEAQANARPKLGDDEWMRTFREFIKSFNAFVEALDDGKLDRVKWERMRVQFQQLEMD
jgi:hypothetical protein